MKKIKMFIKKYWGYFVAGIASITSIIGSIFFIQDKIVDSKIKRVENKTEDIKRREGEVDASVKKNKKKADDINSVHDDIINNILD